MANRNRYDLQAVLYEGVVRAARDTATDSDVCRVAVTQEANGFAVWCAFTYASDVPEERMFRWLFSAHYDDREEALECAVARVKQAKIDGAVGPLA